jgi:hypothetical protein
LKKNFLLFFLTFSLTCKAQYWAPAGAIWHYTVWHFFSPLIDYQRIESVGDTVINGTPCKILQKNIGVCDVQPDREYMYDSSGYVFFWDPDTSSFALLYNFNAIAGQSWKVPLYWFGYTDSLTVNVDSVSQIVLNGFPRRMLYVNYLTAGWGFQPYGSGVLIETIGDTATMFPWTLGVCDAQWAYGIRCYEDTIIGFVDFDTTRTCDSIFNTGIVSPADKKNSLSIYPNPTQTNSIITFTYPASISNRELLVYDITGKEIARYRLPANSTVHQMQLPQMHAGLYVARLSGGGGEGMVKFVVE